MNLRAVILLCPVCVLVAGCASPNSADTRRAPYVKPSLIMLTADQAERRGINVDHTTPGPAEMPNELGALDASAVVTPPGVKVYTLSRAVDPADSDLMHEEHVVYRRETTPGWRLQAPAGQKILVGPRVTDGRQELQPLLEKELTTFLSDQRRATEANQKAIAALFQEIGALNRQHEALARQLGKDSTPAPGEPPTREGAPAPGAKE